LDIAHIGGADHSALFVPQPSGLFSEHEVLVAIVPSTHH